MRRQDNTALQCWNGEATSKYKKEMFALAANLYTSNLYNLQPSTNHTPFIRIGASSDHEKPSVPLYSGTNLYHDLVPLYSGTNLYQRLVPLYSGAPKTRASRAHAKNRGALRAPISTTIQWY